MRARNVGWLVLLAVVAWVPAAPAAVKLASIVGDNMVLQRGEAVPIWGWDDPGTQVTVSVGETKVTATADAKGKWSVQLPAMTAGGPHTMTVAGTTTVTVNNILVGDVWILGGQSNMEFPISNVDDGELEIVSANFPQIRLLTMPVGKGFDSVAWPGSGIKSGSTANHRRLSHRARMRWTRLVASPAGASRPGTPCPASVGARLKGSPSSDSPTVK